MAKRLIVMLMVLSAIVGGIGFLKFRLVQVAKAEGASFQSPSTAVTTVIAQRETWPSTLTVIGTAAAIQGVTVSADLPGTVDKIRFESGQWVHEGDVLVELDTRQERAQLANMEAQRDPEWTRDTSCPRNERSQCSTQEAFVRLAVNKEGFNENFGRQGCSYYRRH